MFIFTPKDKSGLEKEIDRLLRDMSVTKSESVEYSALTNRLETIYKLKEIDTPRRVSPDTLAIIAGNLIGIILIVGHEKANVVTSKALGFVLKLR